VQAVLDWILQEAGVQVELLADPERVREGEEKRLLANIDRIMEHSDWRPERRLEDTIRETYRWFADRIV
jgi:nucleoside-diphosphate-sugar epimerase